MNIAGCIHQKITAVTTGPRRLRPGPLHPGLDEINHPFSEGSEFVLAFDGERPRSQALPIS